jgi:hypothetical protein
MVPSDFPFIIACRLFVLKLVINKTHQYCANNLIEVRRKNDTFFYSYLTCIFQIVIYI